MLVGTSNPSQQDAVVLPGINPGEVLSLQTEIKCVVCSRFSPSPIKAANPELLAQACSEKVIAVCSYCGAIMPCKERYVRLVTDKNP